MGDILESTTDFNAVRDLVPVDSTEFTDSQIEQLTFLEIVETLVKDAISDWATLKTAGGADWVYVKNGTACLLALKIAKRFASGTKSSGAGFAVGGYREQGGQVDWATKKSELLECAAVAFTSISTQVANESLATLAVFAGPTSSGVVPDDYEAYWEKIQPRYLDFLEEDEDEDDV